MTEIILHLSSGQGPKECEWVVAELAHALCWEGRAAGLLCEPLEPIQAPMASALLRVSGDGAEAFAALCVGTIRWIGTSPFRPLHKRRNWFAGVQPIQIDEQSPDLREQDIRYQTFRASGPGGQHVNKTDSAVRATHLPTGLVAVSQDQRSQFANKKIARLKLAAALDDRRRAGEIQGKRAVWDQNRELERGNAVRTYEGERFRRR
ncbi:peptide chain release factor H [Sphingomonas sp. SORGH_AS_0879]|uniref:peptide chain release factor H n=1 Tax=Sphingomonas sp. SORGH_AS_0879 TaxID=3041790 RepID=UPI00278953A7|nr:peptide chain release factor H [Sphingomonas sp. SORGH_AS_0879]MDQ1231550.1 peptide chain release factor [Sphingomonas sp. SORGH_AS_0879]